MEGKRRSGAWRLLAAFLVPVLAGCAATPSTIPPPAGPESRSLPFVDPERGVLTLAPVAERSLSAVTNIAVRSLRPDLTNPLYRDPFFRRFFGLREPPARIVLSAGSGVIVDAARGLVLTNRHVVEGAREIAVTLRDGRRYPARLLGLSDEEDIALLQIPAEGLSALPFGDPRQLRVGDFVIAIGNPFGLGHTVTSGIVSALQRTGYAAGHPERFIQTDAPINPGNSGGALIDTRGRLVGINTAIIAPGGGNVGIGFAVPADRARAAMLAILELAGGGSTLRRAAPEAQGLAWR